MQLVNPVVRGLLEHGLMPRTHALLETTGRKSGQPRRVPVGNGLRGDTFAVMDALKALGAECHVTGDTVRAVLLEGILGIIAGVIAFLWPDITAIALVYVIAAWSLLTGALEVAAAIRLRRQGAAHARRHF